MVKITFYGGVNEIGGNKILLESSKAKVWFDFGLSFSRMNMFYEEFMQPRKINGLGDFFEMGLLPDLKGLYRCDFLGQTEGRCKEKADFDAVFLTHPHVDHVGFVSVLNKDIPIFCGETTKLFLQTMQETSQGFEVEYIEMKEQFTGKRGKDVPRFTKQIETFRSGEVQKLKDLIVKPIHVDHSIPGAYGYIIDCSKRIVYTGDYRLHGNKPEMTKDFLNEVCKDKVDVLITEGTRANGEKTMSEEEVIKAVSNHIKDTKGLVVANFPPRDIDRFNTYYKATVENDRKLIINLKQAYLLQVLQADKGLTVPKPNDKNILIYEKRLERCYNWQKQILNDYGNVVGHKDVEQKNSVFYCDSYSFSELIDVKPISNSSYIYSLCEPFSDAMELDWERYMNWIKHFNLKFYQAHASGHCSKEELKEVVEKIDAKKVIPVHTNDAVVFREFTPKVELVKVGEKIKV